MRALLLLSTASLFACGSGNAPTPASGGPTRDAALAVAAKADARPTVAAPVKVDAALAAASAPATPLAWSDLTVEDANFSLRVPGKAVEVPTGNGDPRFKTRAWAVPLGAVEWGLGFNEYDSVVETPDIAPILDGGQNGFLKGFNAKLTAQHDVKLGAHPGRDFMFETDSFPDIPGHVVGRTLIYIVGGRSYQLMLFHRGDTDVPAADQDQFFGSLRLLHDPGPPAKQK